MPFSRRTEWCTLGGGGGGVSIAGLRDALANSVGKPPCLHTWLLAGGGGGVRSRAAPEAAGGAGTGGTVRKQAGTNGRRAAAPSNRGRL